MSRPRFPIYIPSKSRWASCMTMRALDAMGVDYTVIVEADQHDKYAAALPHARLLILDPAYRDGYDPFDEHGQSKPLGSGPARNMAWEDSIARGFTRHWIIDDNIRHFKWLNGNHQYIARDAMPFVLMEDFTLRYLNVAMSGPAYMMFAPCRHKLPPFVTGTRLYSCILIRNDLPFRWRGRWNEDVDLSLRVLKAGWNTVQFNAFLQQKLPTQTLKGGNTEAYRSEGTLVKSQMLVAMHPDVTRLVWRFGRPHHHVDYSQWRKRALIPDPNAEPPRTWEIAVKTGGK